MPEQPESRIERIVDDLLRGRRLRLRAGDAEEKEAIIAAARLAAARSGPQRMSPAFRRRLAQILDSSPREPRLTRRSALVAGLGVAAGALAGGIVARELASSPAPLPLSASSPVVPRNGRWTDVGALADFSEGQDAGEKRLFCRGLQPAVNLLIWLPRACKFGEDVGIEEEAGHRSTDLG